MTQREQVSSPNVRSRGHIEIKPSVYYVGTPVALMTSLNPDGSANISPMSSAWAIFDRFVLGLTSTSMGRENLARQGELVLNFPSAELWPRVEAMARSTGRNPVPRHKADIGYRFDRDKFALGDFTPQPSLRVKPPRIAECPLQFEAVVVARHGPAGSWPETRPEAFEIVEVKVVGVHARPDIVLEGSNHIDTAAWRPLVYMFRHYFGVGRDLGRTFKAEA